ncbi:MAG: hypothetical protein PVH52_01255 [bacterium]
MKKERRVPQDGIRQAVCELPDVDDCQIEFDKSGAISAIHVLSRTRRPPKQIVRDIESVLQARFGIAIDHRKVSVAKVPARPEPVADSHPARAVRPRLVSVSVSIGEGRGSCTVVLERGGLQVDGEATGVAVGPGTLRLIANATFRALERLVSEAITFDLLDVVRLKAGDRDTLLVLANYVSNGDVRSLAGCVQYEGNEQEAVVHATLDACNRIVEMLPQTEQTEYEISPFEDE